MKYGFKDILCISAEHGDNILELGEAIPEALYRTIAEIIAFAWHLKGKAPDGFREAPAERDVSPLPLLLSGPTD